MAMAPITIRHPLRLVIMAGRGALATGKLVSHRSRESEGPDHSQCESQSTEERGGCDGSDENGADGADPDVTEDELEPLPTVPVGLETKASEARTEPLASAPDLETDELSQKARNETKGRERVRLKVIPWL